MSLKDNLPVASDLDAYPIGRPPVNELLNFMRNMAMTARTLISVRLLRNGRVQFAIEQADIPAQ